MFLLYEDFIYLLRDHFHRWPWWITPAGEIRTETMEGEELDPLTAMYATVHHVLVDLGSYRIASRYLGLDSESADAIAQAADLRESYNAHVRADLTHALRLKEQWGRRGRWGDPAWENQPYPHQFDRPFRHGSGSGGFASAAARKGWRNFTSAPPKPASRWSSRVHIADPASCLWISSVSADPPPGASSSFNVGPSRPGFQLVVAKRAAA